MHITILNATMTRDEESGYVGHVRFTVEGHKKAYELTLQSAKGRDWGYSLSFLDESGPDEEIDAVDEYLDEDDDAFDRMVEAARAQLR